MPYWLFEVSELEQWFKAAETTAKPKPLKEDRRAILQRELDKKIDRVAESRTKKQPARKK